MSTALWAGSRPDVAGARPGTPEPSDPGAVRLLAGDVRLPLAGDWVTPLPREDLGGHVARLGHRPASGGLLTDVAAAGLTGHGGAHVPVADKWRRVLARGDGPLTVVANGAESEPHSAKDALLLRHRPHLVLDGLLLAAEALGARRAVVWLHAGEAATRRAVAAALAERAGEGPVAVEVLTGPSHYLAGESSAVAQGVAGGPVLPTARRPVPAGAPRTLVHNVETLARLALLARGLDPAATTLLTVLGPGSRLVAEVARGTALVGVVRASGWAVDPPPSGVLLGGLGGVWASWSAVAGAWVGPGDPVGRLLGAGLVAPLAAGACPVAETAAITEYLAAMSAGQCGPCVFGLPAIAASLRRLAGGGAFPRGQERRLAVDLAAVEGRGACHHPDGAVRLVRSLHEVFGDHVAQHARGVPCPAARTLPVPVVA